MEFQIRHLSLVFYAGILIPWAVVFVTVLLLVSVGLTLENLTVLYVFAGILALCGIAEIIFILLYLLEVLFGAKIIIGEEYVEIRKLLCRRRIYFREIAEVKYSHQDTDETHTFRTAKYSHLRHSQYSYYFYRKMVSRRGVRALLDFYLTSGRCISLNDNAKSYMKMRDRAKVDMRVNPDEHVRLYQAYQCYCSAMDRYAVTHGFGISR